MVSGDCELAELFERLNNGEYMSQFEWVATLLSKIEHLFVDNRWQCAFQHLPFARMFVNASHHGDERDTNGNIYSPQRSLHHPISISSVNLRDHTNVIQDGQLSNHAMSMFGVKYQQLLTKMGKNHNHAQVCKCSLYSNSDSKLSVIVTKKSTIY